MMLLTVYLQTHSPNTVITAVAFKNLCQTELFQVAMSCVIQEEFSQDITTNNKALVREGFVFLS